jgi:sec-independent protein translocase protein TatA
MYPVLAFGIGTWEIVLILVVIFLIFGATKLPQLGSAIGQGIRNYKRGMREVKAEEEEAQKLENAKESLKPSDNTDASNQTKA